jgi:hypothetical protein
MDDHLLQAARYQAQEQARSEPDKPEARATRRRRSR